MGEQPWTLVAEGDGAVSERKLGNHEAGKILDPSVKVVSNAVVDGMRTVVVSR